MKKGLLILLIALLTVSAFADAADFTAAVNFHVSYGDEGFSFTGSQGTWDAPTISFSVSSDNAGATYQFDLLQPGFINGDYVTTVWFMPIHELKITLGSTGSNWVEKGLVCSDNLYFATTQLTVEKDEDNDVFDAEPYANCFVQLGAAYNPSEGVVYLADNFNIGKDGANVFFHTDSLAKFDVDGKNFNLNYVLSELTGVYQLDADVTSYKKNWYDKFDAGFGENILFEPVEGYKLVDNGDIGTANHVTTGVRYKYFAEESKANQNGLYAYGNFGVTTSSNLTLNGVLDVEVGKDGARLWVRDTVKNETETVTLNNYAVFNFGWSGDKLQARLSETNNKLNVKKSIGSVSNVYAEFKYLNKPENSAKDNGWYLKPGFAGSVAIYGYDASFRFGFDGDKNYHWNLGTTNKVNF